MKSHWMKDRSRLVRSLLVVCVAVSMSFPAHAQFIGTEKAWFTPLNAAPTVDGSLDAVWDAAPWYRMSDILTGAQPANVDDLSAQFKLGYHNNVMYIFVEVNDDAAYGDAGDQPWQRDSVEVYVDLPNVSGDIGDATTQMNAWRNNGGPSQMRFQWDEGSRGFGAEEGNMTDGDAVFATVRDEGAGKTFYEIQLNPPAGLELADIDSFGFVLQVNDSDAANALDKPMIGWWGGPEQPWGEYNPEVTGIDFRPFQNSSVWSEAGFAAPLEISVSISGPGVVAFGGNAILNAVVQNAVGEVSYQWYKNGEAIDGAIDPELILVDVVEEDSGVYAVEVTDEEENTATSSNHNLIVGTDLPAANMATLMLLVTLLAFIGAGALIWKRVRI